MVLTYHEITSQPSDYLYSATRALLEEHVSMARRLVGAKPSKAVCQISFDDGHASQYRHGMPALASQGVTGTFFVTAGWTDSREQYMSSAQLRELARAGHSIQSHGWSHKLLTQCPPAELKMELRRSREALEEVIGASVDAISMPGGRWDDRVLAECAEAGYRTVYTSNPWIEEEGRRGVVVRGRLMVKRTMTAATLEALVQAHSKRFSYPHLVYLVKRLIQRGMGDTIYASVWRYAAASRKRRDIDLEYVTDRPGDSLPGEGGRG